MKVRKYTQITAMVHIYFIFICIVNTVYVCKCICTYVRSCGPTIFTIVCTLLTVKCACYSNVMVLDVHVCIRSTYLHMVCILTMNIR